MQINVTAEHIQRGQKRSCVACPIALAINEQLNPYPTALVSSSVIEFGWYDHETHRYHKVHINTPKRLKNFIIDFDYGHPVEPFAFRFKA